MTDWDILDGNPAPGDPTEVRRMARLLHSGSELACDALTTLDDVGLCVGESGWEGVSADRFLSAFATLGPDLRKLVDSFDGVGGALDTYAHTLEDLQSEAEMALARAEAGEHARQTGEAAAARARSALRTARANYESAESRADSARDFALQLQSSGDPGAMSAWNDYQYMQTTANRYQSEVYESQNDDAAATRDVEEAERDLARARGDAEQIGDRFRAAVNTTIREIQDHFPDGWGNPSLLAQLYEGAAAVVDYLVDRMREFASGVAAVLGVMFEQWLDYIHLLHLVLGVLDSLLAVAFVALLVVTVVLVIGTIVTGGALAPFLLAAVHATVAVWRARGLVSTARNATTVILGVTGHRDSRGNRVVSDEETAFAVVGLALFGASHHLGRPGAGAARTTTQNAAFRSQLDALRNLRGSPSEVSHALGDLTRQGGRAALETYSHSRYPDLHMSVDIVDNVLGISETFAAVRDLDDRVEELRGEGPGLIRDLLLPPPTQDVRDALRRDVSAYTAGCGIPVIGPVPAQVGAEGSGGGW